MLIPVNLAERSYDIEIGSGNLPGAAEFFGARVPLKHVVVVTDGNVAASHAPTVVDSLEQAGTRVDLVIVEPGETTKSIENADRLWQRLLEVGADRSSSVVAVGGGVVGDLAGFVAATYARGIALLQVPTTLLAQVDSSVGGKVGVNLPDAKNMVGAFWQPRGVLIDTDVLSTLPAREFRAGMAEVVKYGVILDADFFGYLEQHVEAIKARQPDVLRHLIARSCQLKADVVQADERELTGRRVVLNYGHTFCHAIEAVTGYGHFLHGEAVAIGMLCASRLAELLGRVDQRVTRRQHDLLTALELPTEVPEVDRSQLITAMQRDKKTQYGRLRFVLPSRLGHVELVDDIPANLVTSAMNYNS